MENVTAKKLAALMRAGYRPCKQEEADLIIKALDAVPVPPAPPELWQTLNALSHRFAYDGPEARALTEAAQIVKAAAGEAR